MRLSAIVLSFDSFILKNGFVKATLDSITEQDSDNFEIILVNNSSITDQRYTSLTPHKRNISYQKILTPNLSRGEARNIGAKMASGDYLLFIDDDTAILDNSAISKIIKLTNNFRYGFGARRFWTKKKRFSNRKVRDLIRSVRDYDKKQLLSTQDIYLPNLLIGEELHLERYSFPGNFGFVKKSLFENIGGFDKRFKGYGGEDDYLAFLMFKKDPQGFKLLYDLIDVLHLSHVLSRDETRKFHRNDKIYQDALISEGVKSFDIEKLFGLHYKSGSVINGSGEKRK